jgi:hypothetical protein
MKKNEITGDISLSMPSARTPGGEVVPGSLSRGEVVVEADTCRIQPLAVT